jgi:hypothetical protein
MEDRVKNLENKVAVMQEIIMALILVQDRVAQFRLRKAYPALDEMMTRNNL